MLTCWHHILCNIAHHVLLKGMLAFLFLITFLVCKCYDNNVYSFVNGSVVLNSGQNIRMRSIDSDKLKILKFTNVSFWHAECPVWDAESNILYWVDVLNQDIYAYNFHTKRLNSKHIAYGEVNVVLPIQNSSRLLVGVRSELFLLDWNKPGDSALRLLAALDIGLPNNILNEGKADARGRFWGGTKGSQKGDQVNSDEGTLYSLEQPFFMPKVQLKPVSISNGLVWARNNSVFYYIDSLTKKIEAFDFNLEKGHISNRRKILDVTEHGYEKAIPDGMTIDRDDMLWIALMFSGWVIRIDPNIGIIVAQYKLPVTQVTSLAWVGENMDELLVTTSRRNQNPAALQHAPLSGTLFILHDLGTGGRREYKFRYDDADAY